MRDWPSRVPDRCLRATDASPIIQPSVLLLESFPRANDGPVWARAHAIRFIDTIPARFPEGWWSASISSYMQTTALENGILYEKSANTDPRYETRPSIFRPFLVLHYLRASVYFHPFPYSTAPWTC